jgi:hypothetical protein
MTSDIRQIDDVMWHNILCLIYHSHKDYSHVVKRIQSRSMSSTMTHFTKSFPKRADITGSPKQAFHMLDNCDKYCKYLLGGISAGTIMALGTIAPLGSF